MYFPLVILLPKKINLQLYRLCETLPLQEISRAKPYTNNRVEVAVEQAGVGLVKKPPALGLLEASNELRKRGLFLFQARAVV